MPLDDPLVQAVCRAWDGAAHVGQLIERLKRRLPQHYRALAKQMKTSGLAERDLPWKRSTCERLPRSRRQRGRVAK
jgi:hypothetical protein